MSPAVGLACGQGAGGLSDQTYRVDVYEEIKRSSQSFQEATAFEPNFELSEFKLTGFGEPRAVCGVSVAGDFFQVLGVQPVKGRTFTREECIKGGRLAVVLTHAFWRQQFGADPAILGSAITLDNRPVTVVGVLPETFDFSAVFEPGLKVDVFVPIVMDDNCVTHPWYVGSADPPTGQSKHRPAQSPPHPFAAPASSHSGSP